MENQDLKDKLIDSLEKVYYMEGFSQLVEFLQGELYVLHFLSQNENMEISPSMLSDILHMTRPRITATLTTLRSKGYIETESNQEDRRRITVILTKKGLNFILDKQQSVEKYFQVFIDGLGKDDTLELIRLINLGVGIANNSDINNHNGKGRQE